MSQDEREEGARFRRQERDGLGSRTVYQEGRHKRREEGRLHKREERDGERGKA